MVILGTRNKITDFLMILAWASPFNWCGRYVDQDDRWSQMAYAPPPPLLLNEVKLTPLF